MPIIPGDPGYQDSGKKCELCKNGISMGEDLVVEKKTIHKGCFKCAYCDKDLKQGLCARDYSLEGEYGLNWWCKEHMTLDPAKKQTKLKKK